MAHAKKPFTDLTDEGKIKVLADIADICIRAMGGRLNKQKALERVFDTISLVQQGKPYNIRGEIVVHPFPKPKGKPDLKLVFDSDKLD